MIWKNQRKRSDIEIQYLLGKKVANIPGLKTVDFAPQDQMQMMMGAEKPISLEIYGDDLEETDALALKAMELMENIQGITDITISRAGGKPEHWVEVDRK